ncbi:phosphatidylethanolamine-binding protein [Pestalotiopsis sp. NC0098]|nr:phosphatidylethanolamine-binding protein [Pestalotiopsis sp. NC0098]
MRAFVPILTLLIAGVNPANLPPFQQPLRGDHYKNGVDRTDVQKVHHELKKAHVIPTVIDDFLPRLMVEADWPSGHQAELGNTLKVDQVQEEPTLTLRGCLSRGRGKSNTTYAVTLTDPDAPSRDNPEWSEFCHFVASAVVQPSSLQDSCFAVQLSPLNDIVPYKAPGPPPKTGKHRYVFLVFAAANGTSDSLHLTKPDERKHWGTGKERHGVRDWAQANGLTPVAANFIYAQNKEQ